MKGVEFLDSFGWRTGSVEKRSGGGGADREG